MIDSISQFHAAIQKAGLEPPITVTPGKFYRFPGVGKCKRNTAGWCILFEDGLGGCYGDWSSGISEHWQAKRDEPTSYTGCAVFKRRVEESRIRAKVDRKEKYEETAEKAIAIWNSAEPAMFH